MPRLHFWRREYNSDAQLRSDFRREQPLAERHHNPWFSRIRNFAAKAMLGVALATGAAVCTSDKSNYANDAQVTDTRKEDKLITKAGTTDENGQVSFEVNGKSYTLNVYDSEELEPIKDLNVLFSLKGDLGTYFIIDQENRYLSKIIGIFPETSLKQKADSIGEQNTQQVSNVVMAKKETFCGALSIPFVQQDSVPSKFIRPFNF